MTLLSIQVIKRVLSIALILSMMTSSPASATLNLDHNNTRVYTSFDQRQIVCLAKNSYYEASSQSFVGMIAVDNVVINRVNSNTTYFGPSPCKVIYQKHNKVCQFSWVCSHRAIKDQYIYSLSLLAAIDVYFSLSIKDYSNGALYYHAIYSHPAWAHKMKITTKIGDHIFMKEINHG